MRLSRAGGSTQLPDIGEPARVEMVAGRRGRGRRGLAEARVGPDRVREVPVVGVDAAPVRPGRGNREVAAEDRSFAAESRRRHRSTEIVRLQRDETCITITGAEFTPREFLTVEDERALERPDRSFVYEKSFWPSELSNIAEVKVSGCAKNEPRIAALLADTHSNSSSACLLVPVYFISYRPFTASAL